MWISIDAVEQYDMLRLVLAPVFVVCLMSQTNMSPDAERRLARDIYKELVEIKSGFTTGSTTPVAVAMANRLKAAGFPESDIFVGGAIPAKANLVVRYR